MVQLDKDRALTKAVSEAMERETNVCEAMKVGLLILGDHLNVGLMEEKRLRKTPEGRGFWIWVVNDVIHHGEQLER